VVKLSCKILCHVLTWLSQYTRPIYDHEPHLPQQKL
jgi:hypothetical protein